jgi:hypothetical protein
VRQDVAHELVDHLVVMRLGLRGKHKDSYT